MYKIYKLAFFLILFVSTFVTISSNSWIGMWLGLEMNLLAFIPLIKSKNSKSSEASMKYFITQAMMSTIILMAITTMMTNFILTSMDNPKLTLILVMNSALLTKMGAAPFHFWFPEVSEGLTWINCLVLFTWQKIAPMILVMYTSYSTVFMSFIVLSSMMISMMGLNQISMRKILAYSSINNIGWMLSTIMFMENFWMIYLIVYTLLMSSVTMILKTNKISTKNQLNHSMNFKNSVKFSFLINFLSLSGLPPFLGFFPKWLVLNKMIMTNFILMPAMMLITTLVTIFIYMTIMAPSLMFKNFETSWNKQNNYKLSFTPMMMNWMSLTGLILCTISFSYT